MKEGSEEAELACGGQGREGKRPKVGGDGSGPSQCCAAFSVAASLEQCGAGTHNRPGLVSEEVHLLSGD